MDVLDLPDPARWESWLATHHASQAEAWLRIAKRQSGITSVTPSEAIDVALCYGWIDGLRRANDAVSFLQRFSRRRPKSSWSRVNVAKVEALVAAGRMRPAGLAEVAAARADGRWEAAYESQRTAAVPPDLAAALDANARASAAFERLGRSARYAAILPLLKARSGEVRERLIARAIARLTAQEPSAVVYAGVLHLLLVSGSTRAGSTNTAVLRTAQVVLPADVLAVLYTSLAELPAFNPDADHEPLPAAVAHVRQHIAAADGVLFCTPEYAGALPGSFKNLLDWTVGGGEMYGKPVAWINAASLASPTGGGDAHASLARVLGYVGAAIIEPACVRIAVGRESVGPDGLITDPEIREWITEAVQKLARALRVRKAHGLLEDEEAP